MTATCRLSAAELAVIVAKHMGVSPQDVDFKVEKVWRGRGLNEHTEDEVFCEIETEIDPDELCRITGGKEDKA